MWAAYVVSVMSHELCQRKCSGTFCKFGRLYAKTSEFNPRIRTFYVCGYERSYEQQAHKGNIYDVCKCVEHLVVEHKYDKSHDKRTTNPNELFARTQIGVEEIRLSVFVARTADAEPAQYHKDEK